MKRILFILLCLPFNVGAQTITTIAGTGTVGFSGDGGAATAATFNHPHSVGFDAAGNLYITDNANNCIRKVTLSGVVTTVIGNGSMGFSGDNGPATAAQCNQPFAAKINSSGYIIVTDNHNHRVRMVDPSGIITTIAGTSVAGYSGDGGPATAAQFNDPTGIAFDASGNVYIGDIFNHRVRKIDMTTGIITTFAGTGIAGYAGDGGAATLARLNNPNFLHIDASGNLFITDNANHRIRKVNTSGIITTVAGTGIAGYSGDGGPATSSRLNYPGGVTTDAAGSIYLADDINHCVRKIDPSGIIYTLAGIGTAGFSGDNGPATAARLNTVTDVANNNAGDLFIADFNNHRVRKFSICSMAISGSTSVCSGATVTLSSSPSGGTWNSGNMSVATVNAIGVVTGVSPGMAVISYTGCNLVTATVTVIASPSAISGTTTICQNTTTTLSNSSPGGSWSSNNAAIATISSTGVVTGISAGTAQISYTTSCGVATATITVDPLPTISGNTTLCTGQTISLSSSALGGVWSSSNTAVATVDGTGTLIGISMGMSVISYSVGCGAAIATITITTSPSSISGITILCQGTTTILSNAASGGSWSSNNTAVATISNTGVVTGALAGSAQISYTTSCGFVLTTVTVNPTPAVSGNTNICTGNTTTISSSVGGGTWSASSPGVASVNNTGVVMGMSPGTSIISYTTTGGCFATATVTVNAAPSAISGGPTVCAGYTITLSNAVGGGTWTSGNLSVATVTSIIANTGQVGGLTAGAAMITYTTGTGCAATINITVLPATPGADTIRGVSVVCTGNTTTLSDATPGGVWSSNAPGVASISSSGVVTAVSPGTAIVSYTISGICGVSFQIKTITVDIAPNAGTITGDASVCAGASVSLSDNIPGGIWSSSATIVATVSGGVVNGLSAGNATITYTITNACASASTTKTITVYDTPQAGAITGQNSVCKGAAYTVHNNVAGGIWTSSNPIIAIIDSITGSIHALTGGSAIITYTVGPNAGGCYGFDTLLLTVNEQPPFIITGVVTNVACYGDNNGSVAVIITGNSGIVHYLWSNGGTTPTINGLAAGGYLLNVNEPSTQCIKTDSFHISAPDSLTIASTIKNDQCNTATGSVTIGVSGGKMPYGYLWSNNSSGAEITSLVAGVYSLTVTDSNSCTKVVTAVVNEDSCSNLVAHDVITPNGDGINDTWVIEGITGYPGNKVSVFDKWGDAVYAKTDYPNDWTGTGKSGVLPDGTYFYMIKLPPRGMQGEQVLTGSVIIKR